MKKLSTLYKKDPNDLGRVINEVDPVNEWVFTDGIPTRKFDGTATAIINGILYKRYDVKKGKQVPENAIPCQEPDEITGHCPHWIKCDINNPADKWHFKGFNNLTIKSDKTYELCGPKVQNNPEGYEDHYLIPHGMERIPLKYFDYYTIEHYLKHVDIEGIVFHHKTDDRMCKIRKSDFGIKR